MVAGQVRAALRDFDANLEIVSTEEQREEAIALATEQEDWLYDDGWDMDAATYRKKRAELAEVGGNTFCRVLSYLTKALFLGGFSLCRVRPLLDLYKCTFWLLCS